MSRNAEGGTDSIPGDVRKRAWHAWRDWSLRTKLLLFAMGLVTLPGGLFAMLAFGGVRTALEREVDIQLRQTAERGAEAIAAALERARGEARSWANQDLMRDLAVGDVDKRVSRFLKTLKDGKAAYLEVLCTDRRGEVVAASSGEWLGKNVASHPVFSVAPERGGTFVGPHRVADFPGEVVEIGAPIGNPDPPGEQVGNLILVYDWRAVIGLLDGIRLKLQNGGKKVTALIVDGNGQVLGASGPIGAGGQGDAVLSVRWTEVNGEAPGRRQVTDSKGTAVEFLVGGVRIPDPGVNWSVLFIEPTSVALAPVRRIRQGWMFIILTILGLGLAAAGLLARQVTRPLDEVTRATSRLAADLHGNLPLLPVRSRNETGQLADSFNKMAVELKRSQEEALATAKLAFAGELAAMVAHEVRTPLSVMRSSAQMLADPAGAGKAHNSELFESIVAEVDRVERVVSGLIELARPLPQRPERTLLADVLSRAAEFVALQAEKQEVCIRREFDPSQPAALCDREQVYQVALNLIVNALQVLPRGGTIWLRTLPERFSLVGFAVEDDGPGLPPEIADRILQPFVTRREGGSGLGLTFVDRVVKAHRGTLSVRSEPRRGTVFEVRLPLA